MKNQIIFCSFFQPKKLPCAKGIPNAKRSKAFLSKCILLLFFSVSMFAVNDASATHYRGGTLSWQQAGGNTVIFTMNTQWRRGYFVSFGNPNLNATNNIGSFQFGDGQIINISATITAVDIPNDQLYMTWTYTKTYAAPGNYNVSALNSCCRLSSLSDANADKDYRIQSIVNVGAPYNNPPVSSLPGIINLPIGATAASFVIPASDPDNDPLTFRLSTQAESGMVIPAPPGLSLSPSGVVTMNTTGRTIGQKYALQVMIEDGQTKTPVDVILDMVGPSAPPVFVAPSPAQATVFNVTPPGNTVTFTIAANDPDVGQSTTFNPLGLPAGASMSPSLPATGPVNGTVSSTFSWTPSPSQVGSNIFNFVAQDDFGIQTFRSVMVNVLCPLAVSITSSTNESCPGLNDGAANISVTNSSGPANLTYTWTGTGAYSSAMQNISGLAPGTYNIRVDDIATGCFTTNSVNILSLNSAPTLATCSDISIPNDVGQCGGTVAFSNTATGMPAPTISYSIPPGVFPVGVATVTAVATNACGLDNCNFTVTITDTTKPLISCQPDMTLSNDANACGATVSVTSPMATDNCSVLTLGNGLNFDGVDDIALVASSSLLNTATQNKRTVEVYFKVDDKNISSQKQVIWEEGGNQNGLNIYVYNGLLYYGIYSTSLGWSGTWVSTATVNSGQWHNAVLVYDGTITTGRLKAYLDGNLIGSADAGPSLGPNLRFHPGANAVGGMQNAAIFHDGVDNSSIGNFFGGDIDEIRLWTIARTAGELVSTNTVQLTGTEPGLEVYYNFDQGAACGNNTAITSLNDIALPPLNGSLSGFALNGGCASNFTNGSPALNSSLTLTNSYTNTADASGTYPIGTTNVVWTATDASYNSVSCTQVITVTDNENPVLTCAANVTVNCQDDNSSAATGVSTATDNCGVASITESDVSTQDPNPANSGHYNYTITRTWTATDVNSNVASCTQVITIEDVTNPSITCPANVTVNCQDDNSSTATGIATGADNCSAVTITETEARTKDANSANIGHYNYTITRTWTATDVSGNASSCNQIITVQDVINPTLSCPADVTINCQDDNSSAATGVATGTDNCSAVSITETEASTQDINTENIGHYNYTITRTWTATDVSGNASSCNQIITVQDVINPTLSCPADIVVNNDLGQCGALISYVATGSDNCSPVSITYSQNPGTFFNKGTTTITATGTDVSGNNVSCNFTVTVIDDENPTIICPGNVSLANQSGVCGSTYSYTVTSTDNCPGEVITQTAGLPSGSIFPMGTTTNTFVVTDGNNNTATCSFDVTVDFDPATVVAYTILAEDDIHLHEDNIVSGNVGVWKANKKAKLHKNSHIYGFLQAPDIDLKDGSTVSGAQTLAQAPMPTAASFKYNTLSSNVDVNVPDNYVGIYQITGTNFDKIDIGKNASVQFMNTGDIFIKELKSKGDNNSTTHILFSGNTDLLIKKKMELKKATDFNQIGGHTVNVYCEDGDVKIDENSHITSNIDVRFKKLDVHGKSGETTYMTGWFIAKDVHGNKDVVWNGACTGPSNVPPSSRYAEPIGVIETVDRLTTELYPNPNNGIFTILVKTSSTETIQGSIYEISGKKVSNLVGLEANKAYHISNTLSNGVYFINIQVGKETQSVKMIKKD